MKSLAAALLTTCAIAAATPTLACSLVPFERNRSAVDARRLPERMLASAAFVEVAVAEDRELLDVEALVTAAWKAEDAAIPPLPPEDAAARADMEEEKAWLVKSYTEAGLARVRFRTVERLKGAGPDSFVLTAFSYLALPAENERSLEQTIRERGDYSNPRKVYYAPNWVQADGWGGPGSCTAPLTVVMGRRYLIFRGADGNLLGEHPVGGGFYRMNFGDGSAFEPAAEDDLWLKRVRKAAGVLR